MPAMADPVKKNRDFTDRSILAAVRLPDRLRALALKKAQEEDLTFSQLMRRALRRELECGQPQESQ